VSRVNFLRGGKMSDIRQWLEELGLGQYGEAFEENAVPFRLLSSLT